MDAHGPRRDFQDLMMYGQICGSTCLMQRKRKQSKNELSRNQSSIMPEDYVVSSSLNQMMAMEKTTSFREIRCEYFLMVQ